MTMRGLVGGVLFVLVAAGCGGAAGGTDDPMFTEDAGNDGGLDVTRPSLDVPPLDRGPSPDTGNPSTPDTGSTSTPDTGGTSTTDTGSTTPVDVGAGGVCPPTCSSHTDCDVCWRAGESRVGQYCCESGACIYRGAGDTCGGGSTGLDGGTSGGADGFSFDGFSFDIPSFGLDAGGFGDASFSFDTGSGGGGTCPSRCSSGSDCRVCGRTICLLNRCLL